MIFTAAAALGCGGDDGGSGGSGTGTGTGSEGGSGTGTGTGTGSEGGSGGAGGAGGNTGGASATCTIDGFDVVDDHIRDATPAVSIYLAEGDAAAPTDLFVIQSWHDMGAPNGPYAFSFDGENYATCSTCALFGQGCPAPSGMGSMLMYDLPNCDKVFLVVEGELAVDGIGMNYAGTITDVEAIEVTIDWSGSFTSTVVPGGDRWCMDSLTFPMP